MIIRFTHTHNGHAGNALVLHLIRSEYWFPAMKRSIKKWLRKCTKCRRVNAKPTQPQIADLPASRVNPTACWSTVGVDLAGPFLIRPSSLKFERKIKTWICVFICFISKAIHVEICTELSTNNFLKAFSRFIARRGAPSCVYSDLGSNFVGTKRLLKESWEKISQECVEKLAIENIRWVTNPAYSPSFGGLWEKSIGLIKKFIKKVDNFNTLTYEEFNTLVCTIESYVNSRPLYPESSDPNEISALTPFLLINQRHLKASTTDFITEERTPVTRKWLQIRQLQKELFEIFKHEYLVHLQKRYRLKHPHRNPKVGDMVIMQEPNLPPPQWKLGRILAVFKSLS